MYNYAIFVLFNTKEFHKMVASIKIMLFFNRLCDYTIGWLRLGLWCLTSLSTIFQIYIVAVSFIGVGNLNIQRKPPTSHKPLTNFNYTIGYLKRLKCLKYFVTSIV